MIKILIVEDEANIAKMIEAALSIIGYECATERDGIAALERIHRERFDLILLDVMLPGMDGFELNEHIRDCDVPVIFLTALQDVGSKVRGLRSGAEDYIVKPFEAVELLARIEVVLRRRGAGQRVFTYGDITLDTDRHIAKRGDEEVALTPKEFDVLLFFLQNQDIAITRERLLSAVWGYDFAGESRTVDIHVQQVRRKMGLVGRLVTIPKLGYRLEKLRDDK